jgi:PAS domain S-box-containing protein
LFKEILTNRDFEKYVKTFKKGEYVFFEGDETQDLYVLVSGRLEVIKGTQKIQEIEDEGELFGELSFILGGKRTASVRADTEVKVICIPKDRFNSFLNEFPSVWKEISKLCGHRLDEADQALYGLKSLSDKLPDAVTITDRNGKLLTWNAAAEKLFGRDWHQMDNSSIEDLYQDPQVFTQLLEEVRSKHSVKEKFLKIKHPQKGVRSISMSTTALYNVNQELQGVLSIGRDVTGVQNLEQRYQRTRKWLIPALVLLVLLGSVIVLGYPYFSKGLQTVDNRKLEVKNQLAKDYFFLESILFAPFAAGDRNSVTQISEQFFNVQNMEFCPYTGLVMLDKNKKVFASYSVKPRAEANTLVGSSYSDIDFQGAEKSIHRILVLYRTDKDHPMGQRAVEVAFELKKDGVLQGWLLFQMDLDCLKDNYGVEERDLRTFQFRGS